MFNIPLYRKVPSDTPIITSEYKVLHFDHMPILYCGKNRRGEIVLGSSVDEDYEKGIERHFSVPIDLATYSAFINGAISYRDVLEQSKVVFVIDRSFDGRSSDIYYVPFSKIPKGYLPLPDSFCPPQPAEESLSLNLYASLSGGLADKHIAVPSELNKMQLALANAVDSFWEVLRRFVEPKVYVGAYAKSSFGIQFEIKLPAQISINTEEYVSFYRRLVRFSFNYLPTDMAKIVDKTLGASFEFESLFATYASFHGVDLADDSDKSAELRKQFITDLVDVAGELRNVSESIGEHFSKVSLFDDVSSNIANVIGVVNEDFRDRITSAVELAYNAYSELDEDVSPQLYSIQVYSFNTRSRKGIAQVLAENERGERMLSTARITVMGKQSLRESKYTKSLDLQLVIEVRAIAYRQYSKIFRLTIIEE